MSQTPFDQTEGLRIGTVDFVSPDELKVLLDIEAPETVALNAGGVRPFPRVNGYVLIPLDDGCLVGQIEWLTIERSAFPKRRGIQDFGLIDLPYPLRKLSLNPLGTLRRQAGEEDQFEFRRGADALPGVGASVLLPTERQLRSIVESGRHRRVRIGTSPLAGDAEVRIDPDRMFGRHLAVLGNTGSGKSCSVAGLIRWSLEAARRGRAGESCPNARFIVLDPNGEYAKAFEGTGRGIRSNVVRVGDSTNPLRVPLWLWNTAEWVAFTKASAKTQRPALIQALRFARDGDAAHDAKSNHVIRRFLRTMVTVIRVEMNTGSPWGSFPKPKSFFEKIEKWKEGLEPKLDALAGNEDASLRFLVTAIDELCVPRRVKYPHWDFTLPEVEGLLRATEAAHAAFGGGDADVAPAEADTPIPFDADELLRCVEAAAELLNVSEHVETFIIRLRSLLSDPQMKSVIVDESGITLDSWLASFLKSSQEDAPCVTIVDLSLVPSEIIHIVTSVTARLIFEALQRFRRTSGSVLPTVIVMEEAHTFVKRYKEEADTPEAAAVCCQAFERIAREGRKYGLGLIVSSQRPSELSPTVLSQCNTFLLHRISNDRDQELVHRFVPDNLRSLLRELPSLSPQSAVLLGWATELPVLVKVDHLPKEHRPLSEDPDFWSVWTGLDQDGGEVLRPADWSAIAKEWQSGPSESA
ncbi:MAG: ATP-binding protein [Planctomycetota bacterium]|nr:MAG: ATP-binding protein [Planctomycetota bacterium]